MKKRSIKYQIQKTVLFLILVHTVFLGYSQNNKVTEILGKFEYIDSQMPYNKLFVATDKHFYFSSDTIFFQTYLTNPKTNILTDGNVIGHLALLNKQNKTLDQIVIKIKNGLGTGYFVPQQTIQTDEYIIVGYTGSMKNYAPDFYFQKKILIFNGCFENESSPTQEPTVNFYSEGGNFVEGISNRIAFEIPLGNTNFKPTYAVIKNDVDTDSIITTIDQNGIGTFDLNHIKGKNYYANIYDKETVLKANLPEFVNSKLALKAKINQEFINLEIQPSEFLTKSENNISLFFYQGTKLLFLEQIKINNGNRIVFKLPTQTMKTGLSHLVILNEDMEMLAQRLLFIDKESNDQSIELNVQDTLSIKNKQQAIVINSSSLNLDLAANYCVNAIDQKLLNFYPNREPNIITYNYLTSEMSDRIFNPNYYFTKAGKAHINNMLIAKKGTRIDWKELLSSDITEKKIYVNRSSLSFQGQAKYLNSKETAPDSILFSFYMSKSNMLFETYTEADGNIDVKLLFDFEESGTVIYRAVLKENQSNEPLELVIEQPNHSVSLTRLNGFSALNKSKINLSSETIKNGQRLFDCSDFIQGYHKRNVLSKDINKSYNYYIERKNKPVIEEEVKGDIFSHTEYEADLSRTLDEFVSFESMHRVAKEILHNVLIRKRKGNFIIKVFNKEIRHTLGGNPLFIIDGSPTYDLNKFLDLNPANVEKVDVITSYANLNKFGNLGKYGVIIVKSKADKIVEIENKNIIKLKGLQPEYSKSFPVYSENKSKRIPDFRSTIYWSPFNTISTDGEGQFEYFHSDDVSDFVINIQGITKSGKPFQKQVSYKATF